MIAYVVSNSLPQADRAILPDDAALVDGTKGAQVDAAVADAIGRGATQVRVVGCCITTELCRLIAARQVWYMPYRGLTLKHMVERS